jgi:hypothetical protein
MLRLRPWRLRSAGLPRVRSRPLRRPPHIMTRPVPTCSRVPTWNQVPTSSTASCPRRSPNPAQLRTWPPSRPSRYPNRRQSRQWLRRRPPARARHRPGRQPPTAVPVDGGPRAVRPGHRRLLRQPRRSVKTGRPGSRFACRGRRTVICTTAHSPTGVGRYYCVAEHHLPSAAGYLRRWPGAGAHPRFR